MKRCTVTVDASFCPKTNCAGWACWISWGGEPIKIQGAFRKKPTDAGQAELWAITNAVHVARRYKFTLITVNADCQEAIRKAAREHCTNKSIRFKHVKAHTRSTAGARFYTHNHCDKMARREMRKWRDKELKNE